MFVPVLAKPAIADRLATLTPVSVGVRRSRFALLRLVEFCRRRALSSISHSFVASVASLPERAPTPPLICLFVCVRRIRCSLASHVAVRPPSAAAAAVRQQPLIFRFTHTTKYICSVRRPCPCPASVASPPFCARLSTTKSTVCGLAPPPFFLSVQLTEISAKFAGATNLPEQRDAACSNNNTVRQFRISRQTRTKNTAASVLLVWLVAARDKRIKIRLAAADHKQPPPARRTLQTRGKSKVPSAQQRGFQLLCNVSATASIEALARTFEKFAHLLGRRRVWILF